MSKVTAVTDAQGQIVVIRHGHLSAATAKKSGFKGAQGGLRALPGQQLHDVEGIKGFRELHDKVRPHLRAKP